MGLGSFFIIEGGKRYRITMFFSGLFFVSAIILIFLFSVVLPAITPIWAVWLCLIVSLGMGSGVGVACQRWSRIGVLVIGAWIGGLLGAFFYDIAFNAFGNQDN